MAARTSCSRGEISTHCSRSSSKAIYPEAVARASTYDRAAREHYSGFFASRCNYDVIRGFDAQGKCRCGVLEQSWRIGGASGAEVAALELFAADAGRNAAKVCCTERYGGGETPPEHAIVYTTAWMTTSASSRSTQRSNTMPTRDRRIRYGVDDEHIAGTIICPETLVPGVLLADGWGGSQKQYLARAREIAALGCICLTFDLRGHARSQPQQARSPVKTTCATCLPPTTSLAVSRMSTPI